MRTRATRNEDGSALIVAIVLIVLIATIVGVLMQTAQGERTESSRALVRAEQIAIADSAVSRFLVALNTGTTSRKTNFQLTAAAFLDPTSPLRPYIDRGEIRLFSYAPGATSFPGAAPGRECTEPMNTIPTPAVVRREGPGGAAWPVDDGAVGSTRFVVEEDHPGRPCAYWEVYRVDPLPMANLALPLSSYRHVGVIFRVWSSAASTPRYVRTTLSRGVFSDYQLLTDDEIDFGNGVLITGKVHSNNYRERASAITGPASLNCAGASAKVSARSGTISFAATKPACRPAAPTGRAIDLGAMEQALREVDEACAADPTNMRQRCFGSLGGEGYRVVVGNPIVVSNATTGAFLASISPGSLPYTLRFSEDRVYVRDGASAPLGSVSIFAHSDDVSHIYIEGSSFGPPTSGKPVIGLLAQGDIVVNAVQPGCGDVTINAAMMSETGTVTVPHKWLSQIRQSATPQCGTLTVNGAVATRTMPVLQMNWGGPDYGFAVRNLNWNTTLRRVVPPMFPPTGPWEMGTWREANHDCLGVNIPAPGSECAL